MLKFSIGQTVAWRDSSYWNRGRETRYHLSACGRWTAQQRGGLTDREGEKDVMGKTGTETDVKHKSSLSRDPRDPPCAVEKVWASETVWVSHVKTRCYNWEPSKGHCQAWHFGKYKFLYLPFPGSSQQILTCCSSQHLPCSPVWPPKECYWS